jgi:hypothetical protein
MGESKNEETTDFNDHGAAPQRRGGMPHLRLVPSRTGLPTTTMPTGDVHQSLRDNGQLVRHVLWRDRHFTRTGNLHNAHAYTLGVRKKSDRIAPPGLLSSSPAGRAMQAPPAAMGSDSFRKKSWSDGCAAAPTFCVFVQKDFVKKCPKTGVNSKNGGIALPNRVKPSGENG